MHSVHLGSGSLSMFFFGSPCSTKDYGVLRVVGESPWIKVYFSAASLMITIDECDFRMGIWMPMAAWEWLGFGWVKMNWTLPMHLPNASILIFANFGMGPEQKAKMFKPKQTNIMQIHCNLFGMVKKHELFEKDELWFLGGQKVIVNHLDDIVVQCFWTRFPQKTGIDCGYYFQSSKRSFFDLSVILKQQKIQAIAPFDSDISDQRTHKRRWESCKSTINAWSSTSPPNHVVQIPSGFFMDVEAWKNGSPLKGWPVELGI